MLFVTITPHPQLGTAQASVRRWVDRAAAPLHGAVCPAGGEVNPLAGQPRGHLDVVTVGGRRQAGRSTFRMTPCAHNARKGLRACGARPGERPEPFGVTGGQTHHLYPGGRAARPQFTGQDRDLRSWLCYSHKSVKLSSKREDASG